MNEVALTTSFRPLLRLFDHYILTIPFDPYVLTTSFDHPFDHYILTTPFTFTF